MIDENFLNHIIEYNKKRKEAFKNGLQFEEDIEIERKLKARYNKVSRIKQHFIYMVMKKNNLYFLTFTFDDKYINKCDRTKKDLIKNLLKEIDFNSYFILNVDYGSQTERQHYHCIFGTNKDLDLKSILDKYYPCYSYTEKIRLDTNCINKIPKYINKLSNHAIKDSTKGFRLYFNFKGYGDMSVPEVKAQFILDKYILGL